MYYTFTLVTCNYDKICSRVREAGIVLNMVHAQSKRSRIELQ